MSASKAITVAAMAVTVSDEIRILVKPVPIDLL
jgi:hypothetical protein